MSLQEKIDQLEPKKKQEPHKINNNGVEKLYEAVKAVYTYYRFFYHILKRIKIQETGDVMIAGVGYVPGNVVPTLFFNSQAFDKYKYQKEEPKDSKNFVDCEYEPTYEELCGVIVHELMHICQNIFQRQNLHNMNQKVANLAHDVLINKEIAAFNINEKEDCLGNFLIHQSSFENLKGLNLDEMALPEVYDKIFEELKSKQGGKMTLDQLKKLLENGQIIMDYHGFDEADSLSQEMTDEAQAYLNDLIKSSAKECDREREWGRMPGNMQRVIDSICKPKSRWKSTLEHFVQTCRLDTTLSTWKRQSRRYGNRAPGRKAENAPNLLIGIDTSGSIDQETFEKFYSYMIFAVNFCRNIHVVFCDTEITFADELNADQINKFPKTSKGGGGTDMQPIFDYAKQVRVDGIVLLTDACWGTPVNTHNIPTLALVIDKYAGEGPGIKHKIPFD